jgi:hypothetical protein
MKTGYVKTVAAFDKVLGSCNALGARYNPSEEALKPAALGALLEQAQQSLEAVKVARTAYIMSVSDRIESFTGIESLAVRIVRMMAASKANEEHTQDAIRIKRRFYPVRQRSRKSEPQARSLETPAPKARRTSSRRDFDGKMETFGDLIQIVQEIRNYNPNEADLKVEALKTKLADLQARSQAVSRAYLNFSNARIERDKVLFAREGVHDTTTAVKNYIRGAFGVTSRQSDQISKLVS